MERNYKWQDGKKLQVSNKTLIMGVLNVTHDSFSDGGRWNTEESAVTHTLDMIRQGADIIDVGAESTRPGHQSMTAEEETDRLKKILPAVLEKSTVPVSLDTYHWEMISGDSSMIRVKWQKSFPAMMCLLFLCITKTAHITTVIS